MPDEKKDVPTADRSDRLHEQLDVDDLSRLLLDSELENKKLKGWMSRWSRWRTDPREQEAQFVKEAAILLGLVPGEVPQITEGADPPAAEVVEDDLEK